MKEIFEKIYRDDVWGGGSGQGSLAIHNGPYIAALQNFMRDTQVRSVVDLGCGDWQFSHLVDWSGITYDGYDLADTVIDRNIRVHSRKNVQFHHFDGDLTTLPHADLLLVKDVLQHWSNERVMNFLPFVKNYRSALITNCVNTWWGTRNRNIKDGRFRRLDLRRRPFHVEATELLRYSKFKAPGRSWMPQPRWQKSVLLFSSAGSAGVTMPAE